MNKDELYKKAMRVYGHKNQIVVLIEECSELIQASTKLLRNMNAHALSKYEISNFFEEIGDVEIMIEQMKAHVFLGPGDVQVFEEMKMSKLLRLEKNMINIL